MEDETQISFDQEEPGFPESLEIIDVPPPPAGFFGLKPEPRLLMALRQTKEGDHVEG